MLALQLCLLKILSSVIQLLGIGLLLLFSLGKLRFCLCEQFAITLSVTLELEEVGLLSFDAFLKFFVFG